MFTVIGIVKNKNGGEETAISTGFANRGEASRFATGLAKTGKIIRVDIREDPDPTLLETLLIWKERIERLDPALPENIPRDTGFREDLEIAIAVLDASWDQHINALLTAAYNKVYSKCQGFTIAELPDRFTLLEKITEALEASKESAEAEKEFFNAKSKEIYNPR